MTDVSPDEAKAAQAAEAGRYFRHMAQFVGFTEDDARAIKESQLIIEKYIPHIVGQFYDHLLRYPPTRKYFVNKEGEVDQEYLRLRMVHNTTFWRRAATGEYDDSFAHYVDLVGKAHTSDGADPNIYIPERYVIGQMGFVQHAISEALEKELHEVDPDLESRAARAWNLLLMVILELLSRAYSGEHEVEGEPTVASVDSAEVHRLAVDTYERGLGLYRSITFDEVMVGYAEEVPQGERLLVQVGDLSIGIFHHGDKWYALRNHCLHRAGPVATGELEGQTLTCPWHGYQYNVATGEYLNDPSVALDTYQVEVRDGRIHLRIPQVTMGSEPASPDAESQQPDSGLAEHEFRVEELRPGQMRRLRVEGEPVVVYNVGGEFYATHGLCTHARGQLVDGELEDGVVLCPLHGSRFDVTNGAVLYGPARRPLRCYQIEVDGDVGRVSSELVQTPEPRSDG